MKKLIIFDADGVLINSFSLAKTHYNELANNFNLPIANSVNDFDFIFSGYLKTSLKKFGLSSGEIKNFFNLHSKFMRKEIHNIEPFYQVIEILSKYQDVYNYAIASSAYSDAIIHILKKSPYYSKDLFLKIIGRESALSKSEKINIIKNGFDNPIYIGDMVSDILYCKDIQVKIAVVGYGYNSLGFLSSFNPNFLIEKQGDLENFLINLTKEKNETH